MALTRLLFAYTFCTSLLLLSCTHAKKIKDLPGLSSDPSFSQYSDYITVDKAHGRSLFYWFTESQNKPSKDPVVLWLTGGPGCSSLSALLTENGPFYPSSNSTLGTNPYSWNRVANMVWLESPAGVGFSYSDDKADYKVGDVRTTNDTFTFLLEFFKQFPEFAQNDFYITGESYGGHYVPLLAQRILMGNQQNQSNINLKGFMAGNPWTDITFDNNGAVDTWVTHAFLDLETGNEIKKNCNMSGVGPLLYAGEETSKVRGEKEDSCTSSLKTAHEHMGNIDIYNLYVNVCTTPSQDTSRRRELDHLKAMASAGSAFHLAKYSQFLSYQDEQQSTITSNSFITSSSSNSSFGSPCIGYNEVAYMNREDVWKALHVNSSSIPNRALLRGRETGKSKGTWETCSAVVEYSFHDLATSVIPVYQWLFDYNNKSSTPIRILVYSGDVDGIVPTLGTLYWTASLNRTVTETWRPWLLDSQVAGYVTVYDAFTFASVRNAGHMVPTDQPSRAFEMFNSFLTKGALP